MQECVHTLEILSAKTDIMQRIMNDAEKVTASLNGDEAAFDALVRAHMGAVYSFVFRFVGTSHDAEDITQETFFKAWRYLHSYSSASSQFKTWLLRIARNTAIDHLRKKKTIPFSTFDKEDGSNPMLDIPDDVDSAEEELARTHDMREIEAALTTLPPNYRELLAAYYSTDTTLEELAFVLGESLNTVKSRHRRGLAALKKTLCTQRGSRDV